MKKLANLLLVLSLISFSACGDKKNKTDNAAACAPSIANNYCAGVINPYSNPYNGSGSITTFFNKEQMIQAIDQGTAFQTVSSTEYFYFDEYELDEDEWLGFIPATSLDYVGTEAVSAQPNGSILGSHPYGTSYGDIVSQIRQALAGASQFVSYNNGIYYVKSGSTVLYLNTRKSIGANPVQIDTSTTSIRNRNAQ